MTIKVSLPTFCHLPILISDAKSQITSLENANGWFERRLTEADSQSEAAKVETEEKLKQLREEMESTAKSDADEWEKV